MNKHSRAVKAPKRYDPTEMELIRREMNLLIQARNRSASSGTRPGDRVRALLGEKRINEISVILKEHDANEKLPAVVLEDTNGAG
jgi:hypothetical protein